uniref:Ig-like domain-containing protein n=1 Tax=Chelydra serpentina TaxID=8475 RepID=A0A8C3SBP1_CHESE
LTHVPPTVSVSRRDVPDGSVTLSCRARGFYPRPIHVSWVQDGKDILVETDSSGILPNADGTYYTQSSLEISLQQDGHRYACRVEHSSLGEPTLVWGKGGVNGRAWGRGHSPMGITEMGCGPATGRSISLSIVSVNSSSSGYSCDPQKWPIPQ